MDLGAYAQIENLEVIAKENGIDVPRLRGYRLMKDESPFDINKEINKDDVALYCAEKLCETRPFWSTKPEYFEGSSYTDYLKNYYLIADHSCTYVEYTGIRWNRIHGWKRRVLKTYIHNEIKRQTKQWEIWNKYAGRDDVLYIHARIGGGNWSHYCQQVVNQPWFIEKVDDSFDSTYCDIYARITPVKRGEDNV